MFASGTVCVGCRGAVCLPVALCVLVVGALCVCQ